MATQIYASITADNVGDFKKQLADLYLAHFPQALHIMAPITVNLPADAGPTIATTTDIPAAGPGEPASLTDQDTPLPLPATPEPTQAPKKRGRKSNAEKAAEAAAQQAAIAEDKPVDAPFEQAVLASAEVEDPMPKELPGEDLFAIPGHFKREQPAKAEAPAVETKSLPATIDDAREWMKKLLETKGMPAVQEALAKFDANRISALKPELYGEFCEHVSGLLA